MNAPTLLQQPTLINYNGNPIIVKVNVLQFPEGAYNCRANINIFINNDVNSPDRPTFTESIPIYGVYEIEFDISTYFNYLSPVIHPDIQAIALYDERSEVVAIYNYTVYYTYYINGIRYSSNVNGNDSYKYVIPGGYNEQENVAIIPNKILPIPFSTVYPESMLRQYAVINNVSEVTVEFGYINMYGTWEKRAENYKISVSDLFLEINVSPNNVPDFVEQYWVSIYLENNFAGLHCYNVNRQEVTNKTTFVFASSMGGFGTFTATGEQEEVTPVKNKLFIRKNRASTKRDIIKSEIKQNSGFFSKIGKNNALDFIASDKVFIVENDYLKEINILQSNLKDASDADFIDFDFSYQKLQSKYVTIKKSNNIVITYNNNIVTFNNQFQQYE